MTGLRTLEGGENNTDAPSVSDTRDQKWSGIMPAGRADKVAEPSQWLGVVSLGVG